MHEYLQAVHSKCQIVNKLVSYTLLYVALFGLNKLCKIRRRQTIDISHYQHFEADSTQPAVNKPTAPSIFNTGIMWSCLLVRVISLAALF